MVGDLNNKADCRVKGARVINEISSQNYNV